MPAAAFPRAVDGEAGLVEAELDGRGVAVVCWLATA